MLPQHQLLPDPTTGYALNPQRGWVSVYLPSGTTNLFRNPSFERDVLNWTATSDGSSGTPFDRATDAQFRGAYAGRLTIRTGGTFVQIVGSTNATAGQAYALQCHFRRPGAADVNPDAVRAVVNGASVPFTTLVYVADGWWRGEIVYTAVGSNPAGVRWQAAPGQICYVDALQWEQQRECSTYCDGDEVGLIPGEQPPAYAWNGAPHASTASRSAATRAGGLRRNLDAYGLQVVGLIGLGMPPQQNQTVPFAGTDGSFYQGMRRPERGFTIAGSFQAPTPQELDRQRRDVRTALTPDRTGADSPIVLELQAWSGTTAQGEALTCVCSYVGGLEASQGSLYGEKVAIQLVEHLPGLTGLASRGGAFGAAVSQTGFFALRDEVAGTWSFPVSLNAAPEYGAVIFGPDERLYLGGAFTAPGTRVVAYSPATAAYETLSTGLAATVRALAFDRQGRLYAAGDPGLIAGSTVAVWNGAAWAAVGTLSATIYALAYDPVSDVLYAGGSTGGNSALYHSPTASPIWTTITTSGGGQVNALALDPATATLYIAGSFTTLAGVAGATGAARWTGVLGSITAMGTGLNAAAGRVAIDGQGRAWFSGAFTTAGGIAVVKVARWTGQTWEAVPGLSITPNDAVLAWDSRRQAMWVGGIVPPGASSSTFVQLVRDQVQLWPPLVVPDGLVSATALAVATSPRATAVSRTAAAGGSPAPASVTNPGSLPTAVRVRLLVGSTDLPVAQLAAGGGAVLDIGLLTLAIGDVGLLAAGPAAGFSSLYRGDLRGSLRIGSSPASLLVPPGASTLQLIYQPSGGSAAVFFFQPRYGALGDAVR